MGTDKTGFSLGWKNSDWACPPAASSVPIPASHPCLSVSIRGLKFGSRVEGSVAELQFVELLVNAAALDEFLVPPRFHDAPLI